MRDRKREVKTVSEVFLKMKLGHILHRGAKGSGSLWSETLLEEV